MTELIGPATQLLNGGVPTAVPTGVDVAGAQATASNVVNAAQTVAQVANAAASTVLDVKAAWSSPENCIHSNYCRIPVAIIIVIGISIIIGCICCIKGCADCISCCCCRSSARSRERLRPPEPQAYGANNYGYGQQPPPYQPQYNQRNAPGGGGLFPMPERPKYERIGDEEQGIKLDDMRPKHAYLDGDSVVSEPPAAKDTTPIVAAAAVPAAVRMPRAPTAPYPLHDDDGYHTPPAPVLPVAGYGSGRSSPVRRDYQPSPVRPSYQDERPAYGGGGYTNNQSFDQGYRDGGYRDGGYRDDHDAYYYENSRGGYGGSRGGGFNV